MSRGHPGGTEATGTLNTCSNTKPLRRTALHDRREALRTWIADLAARRHDPFDLFVTLTAPEGLRGLVPLQMWLKHWDARVSRRLCGSKWTRRGDERPWGIYLPEKSDGYPQWHGVASVPRQHRARFIAEAGQIWRRVVPSGTAAIREVRDTDEDRARVARYTTKDLIDVSLPFALIAQDGPVFWSSLA